MNDVEPLYKGYRFRNHLKARWAVFFDVLGVKWEYEKERYDFGEFGFCLPDFYLPEVTLRTTNPVDDSVKGIWIEVRDTLLSKTEGDIYFQLADFTKKGVLICVGLPSRPAMDDYSLDNFIQYAPEKMWDCNMVFLQCFQCGTVKVDYWEGSYYQCEKCQVSAGDDTDALLRAFDAARSTRFQ